MKSPGPLAALVAGAALLVGAAWLSPRAIPYNMDEFVHYHALGCATAARSRELPPIRDGCGFFDLRLPFTTTPLPLRSYAYIGSLPSLPFYPFWRAIPDPVAARVQGAVFFLLWLWLAARLLRVGGASILVASLAFPVFLATFVVDEGPVGLSALLFVLALLVVRRALAAGSRRAEIGWAVLAGLCLFLGLWVKLVFAWWLPAFAAFAFAEARRRSPSVAETLTRRWRAILAGSLAVLLPTVVLLASTDLEGRPYAAASRWSGVSAEPEAVGEVAAGLARYVVDGSLVAPRNLALPSWPVADAVPAVLAAALLVLGLWRGRGRRAEIAGWTGLAGLTLGLVASSGHSRWPHHFAFPLLLLVFALALCLEVLPSRGRLAAAAVAALFWATLAARLPSATFPVDSSPDKDHLLAAIRESGLDRSTLQLHASWGTYYTAQLFGDPQRMLVYARRAVEDPARLRQVAEIARGAGRPILLLSSRRWEKLQTPEVEAVLGRPERTWHFGSWWAVEYAPSGPPSPRP